MNITDYLILGISLFSFWHGWKKGFLRTIIGPGSLFFATIASIVYFQKTQSLLISLLIGILGPFGFQFVFSLILGIWQKATNPDKKISSLSSLLGAIFSCLWNTFFATLFLALILLIPSTFEKIISVQERLKSSLTYSLIRQWIPNQTSRIDRFQDTLLKLKDPEHLRTFESSPEFKKIMNDAKVKEILSDKDLIAQIQSKKINKILTNPKIQNLLKDKALIQNFLDLEKKMIQDTNTEKKNTKESKEK